MLLTNGKTAWTDDKKAGKAVSLTLGIPMPPKLMGSDANDHVSLSKMAFVSVSNVDLISHLNLYSARNIKKLQFLHKTAGIVFAWYDKILYVITGNSVKLCILHWFNCAEDKYLFKKKWFLFKHKCRKRMIFLYQ